MIKSRMKPLALAIATLLMSACGEESLKSQQPDSLCCEPAPVTPEPDIIELDYIFDMASAQVSDGSELTVATNDVVDDQVWSSQVYKIAKQENVSTTTLSLDDQSVPVREDRSMVSMFVRVGEPVAVASMSQVDEESVSVTLKLEDSTDPTQSVEVAASTTRSGEWEKLTFDFSSTDGSSLSDTASYDKTTLSFDFADPSAQAVVYWDDLRLEGVGLPDQPTPEMVPLSDTGKPILGNPEYQAISYGAWRSTIREGGELVPTIEQHVEDMKILSAMGINVIRTYNTQSFINPADGKSNTENLLAAIAQLKQQDENFEMYVMLGVWIGRDEQANDAEMAKAKELALAYPDIIKVIAAGNEAIVAWAQEYNVLPSVILGYVNELQDWKTADASTSNIWVTTSDNWAVWAGRDENGNANSQQDLKALIEAVDYVSMHTYAHHDTHYNKEFNAQWQVAIENQSLTKEEQIEISMDKAFQRTLNEYVAVQTFVNSVDPTKPVHIGETGWSTASSDLFGTTGTKAADEYKQKIYHDDMREFSNNEKVSLFYFQAFDEPWKAGWGNGVDENHSEKHFGLIDIECNVKYLAWDKVDTINNLGLTRTIDGVNDCTSFNASFNGDYGTLMASVETPPHVQQTDPVEEGDYVITDRAYIFDSDSEDTFGFELWGDTWGSGAVFEVLEDHPDYARVIDLPSGTNWGNNTAIAWGNLDPANAIDVTGYSHVRLNLKSDGFDTLKVSMQSFTDPASELTFALADMTVLENGWYQVDVPLLNTETLEWLGLIFETEGSEPANVLIANVQLIKKELKGEEGEQEISQPSSAAPAPQVSDDDVLTIFSDSLTENKAITFWNSVWWNPPTYTTASIEGNHYARYEIVTSEGSTGLEFGTESGVADASAYTHFNVNLYAEEGVSKVVLKLVSEGGAATYTLDTPDTGEWLSLSVPFADLMPEEDGVLTLDTMQILGLQLFGETGKAVFIDDIYFSTASDEGAGEGDSNIKSQAYIFDSNEQATFSFSIWGDTWGSGATFDVVTDNPDYAQVISLDSGTNWGKNAAIAWGNDDQANAIDVSTYSHVRFNVKSAGFEKVKVSMQSFVEPTLEVTSVIAEQTQLANGWYQVEVPLLETTTLEWLGLVFETTGSEDANVLISDVQLIEKEVEISKPNSAAPAPAVNDGEVFTVFSDALTEDKPITLWNANWWNPPLYSTSSVDGDNYARYEILTNEGSTGLEFGTESGAADVSMYTDFNIDLYFESGVSKAILKLVSEGGNAAYTIDAPETGQWVTHSVSLSNLVPEGEGSLTASQVKILGLQLFGDVGAAVFVDNVYFSGESLERDLTVLVEDELGEPMPGATVTIAGNPVVTDSEGKVKLTLAEGSQTVLVQSSGYGANQQVVELDADVSVTVSLVPLAPAPTASAPVPTVDNADVITIFSDSLTVDNGVEEWAQWWWNAPEYSEVDVAGNATAKYQITPAGTAGGVAGMSFGEDVYVDASMHTGLRFDLYVTEGVTQALFKLTSPNDGHVIKTMAGVTTGSWITVEIAFDDATLDGAGLNTAELMQLGVQFWGTTSDSAYIDNIYVY